MSALAAELPTRWAGSECRLAALLRLGNGDGSVSEVDNMQITMFW